MHGGYDTLSWAHETHSGVSVKPLTEVYLLLLNKSISPPSGSKQCVEVNTPF